MHISDVGGGWFRIAIWKLRIINVYNGALLEFSQESRFLYSVYPRTGIALSLHPKPRTSEDMVSAPLSFSDPVEGMNRKQCQMSSYHYQWWHGQEQKQSKGRRYASRPHYLPDHGGCGRNQNTKRVQLVSKTQAAAPIDPWLRLEGCVDCVDPSCFGWLGFELAQPSWAGLRPGLTSGHPMTNRKCFPLNPGENRPSPDPRDFASHTAPGKASPEVD